MQNPLRPKKPITAGGGPPVGQVRTTTASCKKYPIWWRTRSTALAGAKSDQRYQWLRNTTPAQMPRNASSDQSRAGAGGGRRLSTAQVSRAADAGASDFPL